MGRFAELLVKREELSPREELELLELAERLEQAAGEVDTIIASATFSERTRFQRAIDVFTSGFKSDSLARGILLHTRNDAGVTGYLGLQDSANGNMSIGVDDALGTNNTATRIFFRHDLVGNNEDGAIFFSGNGSDIIAMVNFDSNQTEQTALLMFDGTAGSTNVEHAWRGGADGTNSVHNEAGRDIDYRFEGDTVTDLLFLNAGTEQVIVGGFFNLKRVSELTIATGAVTATGSWHTIDTESDASTDDLDTVNGGNDGDILVLSSANSARDPTVKDSTGNMRMAGDFTLDNTQDRIVFINQDGTDWMELSRSSNL